MRESQSGSSGICSRRSAAGVSPHRGASSPQRFRRRPEPRRAACANRSVGNRARRSHLRLNPNLGLGFFAHGLLHKLGHRAHRVVYKCRHSLHNSGRTSGPYRTRTCDPLRVMQVRYQLRQRPVGEDPTTGPIPLSALRPPLRGRRPGRSSLQLEPVTPDRAAPHR